MKYPNSFSQLIEHLKSLPGIGEKTATRLAIFIYSEMDLEKAMKLSETIKDVKTLQSCPICGMILEVNCPICSNTLRDQKTIMVVESLKDLMVIENSNTYHGMYHITKGIIDFSKGIEPSDLNIDSLIKRTDDIDELIIAFSGTMMGDLTGNYIKELMKDKPIKISKIAYGIPVGGDLSYADKQTLKKSLDNRVLLK